MSGAARLGGDNDVLMILDVTKIPLGELLESDDSVIARSVRRVLQEIETPGENYAAHSTAL